MVSYMKKMIWGDPAQQAAAGQGEEAKDDECSAANFTGRVTQDQIIKEGWIFKRSRYLMQWKK